MKKFVLITAIFFGILSSGFAQSDKAGLLITADDFYILPGDENGPVKNGNGYHLYIRKKNGIESVLLTESNKDPDGKQTNYAYRAAEYNKWNGDEIRYLNGRILESEGAKYSLIDSTEENNEKYGKCFHIYIPPTLVYGYPWGRNGTVNIADGFYINIRSFEKKYADYTGGFKDNGFMIYRRAPAPKDNKLPEIPKQVKEDKIQGNLAERMEAYSSRYITLDDTDTGAEIYTDTEINPDAYADDGAEINPVTVDNPVIDTVTERDQISFVPFEEELPVETEKAVSVIPLGKDVPSLIPFEESEELDEKPAEESVLVVEIPEDERDPVAENPYDEYKTEYSSAKLERTGHNYDEWVKKSSDADPQQPFFESMDGVDPDFVAKLEKAEHEKLAGEKNKQTQKEDKTGNFYPGERFLTHGIEMVHVEGNKKISDLYISKTEVTQISYRSVTGNNPSKNQGDYNPVESVSWYDVIVFCNLLSIQDGFVPCYSINGAGNPGAWGKVPSDSNKFWDAVECDFAADGYRMLTVEEWEYAANGGVNRQRGKYAGSYNIDDVAWYLDNSEETTHGAGMKNANECGLYDMCGNVSEWCMGTTGSTERTAAVRGGNYTYKKKYCRTDFKDACQAWYANFENGIRICRNYYENVETEEQTQ